MTSNLKLFLNVHREEIEKEQWSYLYSSCPKGLKKELVGLLLTCGVAEKELEFAVMNKIERDIYINRARSIGLIAKYNYDRLWLEIYVDTDDQPVAIVTHEGDLYGFWCYESPTSKRKILKKDGTAFGEFEIFDTFDEFISAITYDEKLKTWFYK